VDKLARPFFPNFVKKLEEKNRRPKEVQKGAKKGNVRRGANKRH
jgi:hypothetical protein